MARIYDPPPEYAPGLMLYLREQAEGGNLPAYGKLRGPQQGLPRPECVVLVHGFNDHYGEAGERYYGFRVMQRRHFAGEHGDIAEELERLFGDTFWPGDADWPGPLDWLDALVYPVAVHTAQDAAKLLADLIERIPGLLRAHFVAHSLGCRVVLEAVKILWERGYPSIGAICLMAAAVDRDAVSPGGRFADLLAALGDTGSEILVLHSRRDKVLRFTFPLGQTGAGEGFLPEALGLEGPPPGMPGRVAERRVSGANHGDYWGHRDNDPSRFATREAGGFLKLGERVREIRAREPEASREIGG